MRIEVYIAIGLAVFAVWLLVRHVRGILRGEGGGCGCCKGSCGIGRESPQCPPNAKGDESTGE